MALDLALSGLASGFDWKSFVDQMIDVERAPQQRLLRDQSSLNARNSALSNIKNQLATLQSRISDLKEADLYRSRKTSVSDATTASATSAAGAVAGTYSFNVTQLATASRITGSGNVGSPLNPTADVSALILSEAGFPAAVTAGTFTVNGRQVTIATSDTLQQVFDKIATATGNDVTAAYNPATDRITLNSSSEIVLGSATDSSNFLSAARLNNNGSGTVTSSFNLGGIRLAAALESAGFSTAVTDGGSGAGVFKINGVSISYNAATDTVVDVLNRINNSSAGALAQYDATNDRFTLTSKATGDMGIALEEVTGNFLAATGLSAGALTRGKDLVYTVNGSDPLTSRSNTITESSSGITGLSVTALKENVTFEVAVTNDTAKIKTAIQNFIEAYNRAQSLIDAQTASSTDAKGVVTAGTLAGDRGTEEIASRLRSASYSTISGLSGSFNHLANLGIVTNGNDNTLSLEDSELLDQALQSDLEGVTQLFSDPTKGLALRLGDYLDKTIGESGTLVAHQVTLTRQSSEIDQQILDLERIIAARKEQMTASFVAMETAQARINQQLQYLSRITINQ